VQRVKHDTVMIITIDRLNLQLPSGFESRAATIVRRVADELARLPWRGAFEQAHVQPAPITVRPEQSDRQIAARIARAIHSQITSGKG
jgi:hypothetical protein